MVQWALFIFLVAGVVLRSLLLCSPADYDEVYTYLTYSSQPFLVAIGQYNVPNNHPLNSALVFAFSRIFGGELMSIRWPSLILGIACLPLALVLFTRLFGRATAVLAVGGMALAAPLLFYSVTARGYVHQVFLVLLVLWGIERRWAPWLLGLTSSLAMWAVPTSLYPLAGLFLFMALSEKGNWRRPVATGIWAASCTIVLYLPIILYVLVFGTKMPTDDRPVVSSTDLGRYLLRIGEYFVSGGGPVLATLFLVLFFAFPVLSCRRERRLFGLWCCLTGVPILAVLVSRVVPPFERSWIWLLPFFLAFAFRAMFDLGRFVSGERGRGFVFALGLLTLVPAAASAIREVDFRWAARAHDAERIALSLKEVMRPGDYLALPETTLTAMDYAVTVNPEISIVPEMRRYHVAGAWELQFVRFHAESGLLRRKLAPGTSSRIFTVANGTDPRSETERLLRGLADVRVEWAEAPHSRSGAFKIWEARLLPGR